MLVELLVVGLAVSGGFALGRVKNAKKLAAVRAEVGKIDASASAEVKKLAGDIRAKL
jgi:hypothetical protein